MRALRLRTIVIACAFGLAWSMPPHDSHAKGGGGCCSGNSGTGHNGMPGVTSNGAMGFGATHAGAAPSPAPTPSPSPAPSAPASAAQAGNAGAPAASPNGAEGSCQYALVDWPGVRGVKHGVCK